MVISFPSLTKVLKKPGQQPLTESQARQQVSANRPSVVESPRETSTLTPSADIQQNVEQTRAHTTKNPDGTFTITRGDSSQTLSAEQFERYTSAASVKPTAGRTGLEGEFGEGVVGGQLEERRVARENKIDYFNQLQQTLQAEGLEEQYADAFNSLTTGAGALTPEQARQVFAEELGIDIPDDVFSATGALKVAGTAGGVGVGLAVVGATAVLPITLLAAGAALLTELTLTKRPGVEAADRARQTSREMMTDSMSKMQSGEYTPDQVAEIWNQQWLILRASDAILHEQEIDLIGKHLLGAQAKRVEVVQLQNQMIGWNQAIQQRIRNPPEGQFQQVQNPNSIA